MRFHRVQTFRQIDDLTEKIRQIDDFFRERGCNGTPKIHCKKTFAKCFAKILCKKPLQNPALVILTEKKYKRYFDGKKQGLH